MTVAALYVEPDGPYADLDGVDVWDEARDARAYAGPHPVVAHPPCARWSVLAAAAEGTGGPRRRDDDGCFAATLDAVRTFGGVLEHPANSEAWPWFGMCKPPSSGGWVVADWQGGWTCCVDQIDYGHPRLRKRTWLYACHCDLPSLRWPNPNTPPDGRRKYGTGTGGERVRGKARSRTPEPFRDLLLSMARSAHGGPHWA